MLISAGPMQRIKQSIKECIARTELVSVTAEDTVDAAVAAMLEHKTDCVLVVQSGELVGIFTERDFINRVAARKRNPATVKIGEVMTAEPETLRPHDMVAYAINQMVVGGYRHVPIVDDGGRPTSVLDVRVVMTHLIKLFAEIEQNGGRDPGDDDEWVDIGGG